ncbi:MAG: helix-turn-helix domain-containing protein [Calditrichaeota bacterium]|nr:MAG: helix-turn-helix domain-containing protein [Calditrichota bacterium]
MESKRVKFKKISKEITKTRRELKLSIKEVSTKLRINPEFLKKIEAGDMEFLPLPYVRAFVKSYADFLKMDGHAVLESWAEDDGTGDEKSPTTHVKKPKVESDLSELDSQSAHQSNPEPKNKVRKEILIGAGLATVVVIIILISALSEQSPPPIQATLEDEQPVEQIPFEEVLQEVNQDKTEAEVKTLAPVVKPVKEVLNLRIAATDSVWVKVIIDELDESEAIFAPGHVRSFQALEQFHLQIGNAAGIKLYLNEKELGQIGRSGQVRYITVDHEGIKPFRRSSTIPAENSSEPVRIPAQEDTLSNN